MFGRWLKLAGEIITVVPVAKKLWYAIKKNVPRVTCPQCDGKGEIWIRYNPDNTPSDKDTRNKCPLCNGKGTIRKTDVPEDKKGK